MALLPKVERSMEVAVSPEDLWRHIVKGDLASLWMGGAMTLESKVGGRVLLRADGAPDIFGTVEEMTTGESIIWTWRTSEGEPTQVRLKVEKTAEGSLLSVCEEMLPYEILIIPPVIG